MKEVELTNIISQGVEGQLLNVVKKEEERYVGIDEKHSDDVFEKGQVENELLRCLLEASKYEKRIAGIDRRMFQVLVETAADTSLVNYVMFASIQRSVSEYVAAVREWKNNLLFESKFDSKEQQLDIAKGDIFKDTQEVWVAAISGIAFGAMSRTMFAENLQHCLQQCLQQ